MINIKLDIPKIYNDPIISRRRSGDHLSPFKDMKESITLDNLSRALLTEIPNRFKKVKVFYNGEKLHEVEDEFLSENTFRVDHPNGTVYFHESLSGKTLDFEYQGEGVYLFPDSRIYLSDDELLTARDKFADLDRAILVERHRIDEQILSHPQPSEVVDIRVDYNGKRYRVAKDRIDAEQKKIEEAYVDAKGIKYNSLKERIDSLQLRTESELDDTGNKITNIWAEISLIPDRISLEVGRLENDINDYVSLLQSQIDLIPNQIQLKVQEIKEYIDGEIDTTYSMINMLSNQLELKVDQNGVISSINLSPEGVRIKGKKLWLDGEARIDNAVIKSAHIDSISADKITAGTINADRIGIQGGSSTEYLKLEGNRLELRGQITSTWFGETKRRDVKYQFQDGYFRARNDAEDKSLYFTDYGIHSFIRGYDDESPNVENHGSGVIEFFSHQYDRKARGLTLFSNRGTIGIKTMTRDIILDSSRDIELRAKNQTIIQGTGLRAQAIGVTEPFTNFYIGVSGSRDGELRVTNKAFYNGGDTRYLDVRARYYKGRALIDTSRNSYVYIGSDLGVRITSRGINNNDPIIYRPIQASDFQVRSSLSSKENVSKLSESGLDVINSLELISFNYIGDNKRKIGFVADNSPKIADKDREFIDLSVVSAYLSKAIQELYDEVKKLKKQIKSN